MNFFNSKFAPTRQSQLGQPGMFKPGEVEWNATTKSYHMAGPACICFMLYEAYAPDKHLSAQRHQHNRAGVLAGVALATSLGFGAQQRLVQLLESGKPQVTELRALSDDMLTYVTPESWLKCVFAYLNQPVILH